ncbi:MAG: beta family protein [Pseudomonadota bacterium]
MTSGKNFFYMPALRMKQGELSGLRDLQSDIFDHVLPRFIVPPRKERDAEFNAAMFELDEIPNTAGVISRYILDRVISLDCEYLYDDFGEASSNRWLPKMFEANWHHGVPAIPCVSLSDLLSSRVDGIRDSINADSFPKLVIRVGEADLIDPEMMKERVEAALEVLRVEPQACIIVADFKGSGFDEVEIAAGVVGGAIESLQELGLWYRVGFQGTHYPLKNPAGSSETVLHPRNEWLAWKKGIDFGPSTPDQMMFGDYAPDHAKMNFKQSGGRPHRHYRYTTPKDWLISRGPDEGRDAYAMQSVSRAIVNSGYYAGREFSEGDDFIYQSAQGAVCGNPTNWRQVNVCHHVTRVVRDMGKVKGLFFSAKPIQLSLIQDDLF